jgi:predicted DNA-binding ribbon-helix-helix protein
MTLSDVVASIDTDRHLGNLSSAIRIFVLDFYRAQSRDERPPRDTTHEKSGARMKPSVLRAN